MVTEELGTWPAAEDVVGATVEVLTVLVGRMETTDVLKLT